MELSVHDGPAEEPSSGYAASLHCSLNTLATLDLHRVSSNAPSLSRRPSSRDAELRVPLERVNAINVPLSVQTVHVQTFQAQTKAAMSGQFREACATVNGDVFSVEACARSLLAQLRGFIEDACSTTSGGFYYHDGHVVANIIFSETFRGMPMDEFLSKTRTRLETQFRAACSTSDNVDLCLQNLHDQIVGSIDESCETHRGYVLCNRNSTNKPLHVLHPHKNGGLSVRKAIGCNCAGSDADAVTGELDEGTNRCDLDTVSRGSSFVCHGHYLKAAAVPKGEPYAVFLRHPADRLSSFRRYAKNASFEMYATWMQVEYIDEKNPPAFVGCIGGAATMQEEWKRFLTSFSSKCDAPRENCAPDLPHFHNTGAATTAPPMGSTGRHVETVFPERYIKDFELFERYCGARE